MNHHFLRCTKTDDKISEIRFETTGRAKVSIIIEDRDIVVQINKRNYVLTPVDPPQKTVFKINDQSYSAQVLKESTRTKIANDEVIILDGDNDYNVNGTKLAVNNDVIMYEGKEYRAGDSIIIDGKQATVGLVQAN